MPITMSGVKARALRAFDRRIDWNVGQGGAVGADRDASRFDACNHLKEQRIGSEPGICDDQRSRANAARYRAKSVALAGTEDQFAGRPQGAE